MVTDMAVQQHRYWFICYIDPRTQRSVIYKTSHAMQYLAEVEARNLLGTKCIPFVVVGVDTLGNDAMQHIKAEAMKLSNDLNYVGRASHQIPAQPYDIMNTSGNNV
jgi:hypothetical protein